jgi:hypothetical protein
MSRHAPTLVVVLAIACGPKLDIDEGEGDGDAPSPLGSFTTFGTGVVPFSVPLCE